MSHIPNGRVKFLKERFDFAIEALVEDFSTLLEELSESFGGVLHSTPGEYEPIFLFLIFYY